MKDESRENRKEREIAGLAFLPISFLPSGLILSSFPHNSKTTWDTHISLSFSLSGDDVVTLYKDTKATSRHLFFSISFFFLFFSICLDFFAERLNQEVEQKFVAFYERVFGRPKK